MNIICNKINILDYDKECFLIKSNTGLTNEVTEEIRSTIANCLKQDFAVVYLDAKDATEADLSGINEVIHTHYTLQQANKKLVFVYKKDSTIQKWVETTGLNKFIETAIVA